jgi:predicted RNA-binding Zn-ribbon protein involved in translation (DUF1610 family)
MGHKKVCFSCRKAFSIYKNNQEIINLTCPNCGSQTTLFNHKFRPPEQNDVKQWTLVEFLKENGFVYQHVYKQIDRGTCIEVEYPKDLEEAKEFVEMYKKQAYTDKNIF